MAHAQSGGASEHIPEHPTLRKCREAVQHCKGCDLYEHATQAVFGEGPGSAKIVFVGEQPGDVEDRQGRPFAGPAGKLLNRALLEAGIDRALAYVTNAVKHFKFEERGKRRLHKKPDRAEVKACRAWVEMEIQLIRPEILVCLGATAAQSIFGNTYRVTEERGLFVPHAWAPYATSTVHPSLILRAPDEERRRNEYRRFVGDLEKVSCKWKELAKRK
jgi:uracil-DNA glycosylase family protein